MDTCIYFLKASQGDCFLIETYDLDDNKIFIMIDGGVPHTFRKYIAPLLKNIKVLDLLVLTHIDDDHISGLTTFFSSELYKKIEIKEYWANCKESLLCKNSNKVSFGSAVSFNTLLNEREGEQGEYKWDKEIVYTGTSVKIKNVELTILSPQMKQIEIFREKWKDYIEKLADNEVAHSVSNQISKGSITELAGLPFVPNKSLENDFVNASSIAFILKTNDLSILFLADARAEVIIDSLIGLGYNTENKLSVDYVKLSHHGSKNNTSLELLNYISCNRYVISTNGGVGRSKHPDRETISRILCREKDKNEKTYFYFNYSLIDIEQKAGQFLTKKECEEFNCEIYENVCKIIPYEK
ncbi:ComEC/Rec2 family competence protein [Elizabethkingia anophelis]|uniref:ComEC/Rec2 family competence protein n=1 Tax=Elizabethkingia anophelis TaxID=1117645 RepID=UPI0020B8FF90|nr:MBL fold metallo-hydrolase [Elizabethkingia anophelis]MCT3905083.1 MBL fold metallo-hydrolase [Elizabethkingia anophelis]UTG60759.1 MBL fold metallo-hydrolase [Elizabethkingia anophelis]UXM66976.1 MBL fold metallo-hydrolase [Elizabethkingia anophelis]CAH1141109.1 hypothetical protein EAVVTKC53_00606 [Elizabethkingia anophelis]CAI9685488.1 hypothetical protein EAVVTKC53_03056 [Elizabethkingia anophelis]